MAWSRKTTRVKKNKASASVLATGPRLAGKCSLTIEGGDPTGKPAASVAPVNGRSASSIRSVRLRPLSKKTTAEVFDSLLKTMRRSQPEVEVSLDHFARLCVFLPLGYVALDPAGVILDANLTAAQLLGISHQQLLAKQLTHFIPREAQEAFHIHRQKVFHSGAKEACEMPMRRKDGTRFTAGLESVATRNTPRYHQQEWLITFSDITHRKHAEQALRENETELAAIYENAPFFMMLVNRNHEIRKINKFVEDMARDIETNPLGRRPGEALSCLYATEHPQGCGSGAHCQNCTIHQILADTLETGRVYHQVEVNLLRSQQGEAEVMTFHLSATPVKVRELPHVLITLEDITERKRAEKALQQQEKELADFFNKSPLGLLWVGPNGRILRVNHAQLELIGSPAEHVLGRPIARFHANSEAANELLHRLARGETIQNQRARIRRKNGDILHVLIDANGLWEKDRLVHSRWVVRDITRRVELEREILAISEREQRRIGHDLHDDLCQQLAGIQFRADSLAKKLANPTRELAAEAREIARLTREAMDQTRGIARGLSPVSMEADGLMIALRQLAANTKKIFRLDCGLRGEPSVLVPNHTVGINLYRIAQEAVSNAVKHSKARRIEIDLAVYGNMVVLTVSDDGIGIPRPKKKPKGMGLRIMQYRAGIIGGSLVVERTPKCGTVVICTVNHSQCPPNHPQEK